MIELFFVDIFGFDKSSLVPFRRPCSTGKGFFFFFCFDWTVYSGADTDTRGMAALRYGPIWESCIFGRKAFGAGMGMVFSMNISMQAFIH